MQIIGFNFTKLSAEKISKVTKPPITNIEFIDFEKEKVPFLKEDEAANIKFKYHLDYDGEGKKEASEGTVFLEGKIVMSISKDELKNITKSWKKKELPEEIKMPLFNLILRRCTPRAITLQDEVNLPFHVPMPRVEQRKKD